MQTTTFTTIFLLFLALGPGCDRPRQQARPTVVPAHQAAAEQQAPHYYGLIEEYKTILAEDPNNLANLIALANAYAGSSQWNKAITLYEHALRIDPHNAELHAELGIACRGAGQADRALIEFRKAVDRDPMEQTALFHMGLVYAYDKKDYPAAIRVWQDLLHIAPTHAEAEYLKRYIAQFGKMAKKDAR